MRVAYLFVMRPGMQGFTYNELKRLIARGLHVELYPVFNDRDYYLPEPDWAFHPFVPVKIILGQPYYFLRRPLRYLRLLWEALSSNSVLQLLIAFAFANSMEKNKVELIHCHFGGPIFTVGYYCRRILGIPLTVMIHASELYANPNWPMFRKALASCDHIVTVSQYNADLLRERFGISPDKMEIVRLSVPSTSFPTDVVNVLIVAGFREKKGHANLFKAVRSLNRTDIHVWVVGSGPLDVRGVCHELGMEDQVVFWGIQTGLNLYTLFAQCDIFCLPSITDSQGVKEGIPSALIEAMYFGKPVISTKHAGIPELVEEILLEENDIPGLAEAIAFLADDPGLRRKQGERNRQIVLEKHPDHSARLEAMFQSCR